ncbi:hypothetical protein BV20DRAFT_789007 [Pilatotrama ljubarskyi]|nr:hypothetical protein BV20DRAFT_789007 [Pilatotrama ljubarskyi]
MRSGVQVQRHSAVLAVGRASLTALESASNMDSGTDSLQFVSVFSTLDAQRDSPSLHSATVIDDYSARPGVAIDIASYVAAESRDFDQEAAPPPYTADARSPLQSQNPFVDTHTQEDNLDVSSHSSPPPPYHPEIVVRNPFRAALDSEIDTSACDY